MTEAMAVYDLKQDFDYYLANQDRFVAEHNGKYIVLRDRELVGVFDSQMAAVSETQKRFPLGTFLVQKVEPGTSAYRQTFHSRASFN